MKADWNNMIEWSLVKRSLAEELSPEERMQLERWLEESPEHRAYYAKVSGFDPGFGVSHVEGERYDEEYRKFMDSMRAWKRRRALRRISGVAAVLLFAVAMGWWMRSGMLFERGGELQFTQPDKQHPVLITADGTRLDLLDEQDRVRKELGGFVDSDAQGLVYSQSADAPGDDELVNIHTIYIPVGGEYRLTLGDGTNVWLNSETEFSYPVKFTGENRIVSLKGEAYFEVSKQDKPFIVKAADAEVTVYGTQFNVNTYQPDVVQTVLVTGRVGITAGKAGEKEHMLKAGEMAEINVATGDYMVRRVDIGSYVAWKDGYFSFDGETLEQIMQKLGRWYDFEVVYQDEAVKTKRFSGHISRDHELGGILETIQRTALVTFAIKGNTITVK